MIVIVLVCDTINLKFTLENDKKGYWYLPTMQVNVDHSQYDSKVEIWPTAKYFESLFCSVLIGNGSIIQFRSRFATSSKNCSLFPST